MCSPTPHSSFHKLLIPWQTTNAYYVKNFLVILSAESPYSRLQHAATHTKVSSRSPQLLTNRRQVTEGPPLHQLAAINAELQRLDVCNSDLHIPGIQWRVRTGWNHWPIDWALLSTSRTRTARYHYIKHRIMHFRHYRIAAEIWRGRECTR